MIFVTARAKINWTLDILGRRDDGYHLMDMLMQSVELCDDIWLEHSDGLTLEAASDAQADGSRTPDAGGDSTSARKARVDAVAAQAVRYDGSNLALRAARLLKEHTGYDGGARIRLLKRIPSGAGMGGGSADAAGVLIGLDRLWKLRLSLEELCGLGLKLGADVPFMLRGGLARVGVIGERIAPLKPAPTVWLVVVQPCDGLSTREIFAAYDTEATSSRPRTDAAQAALISGDISALVLAMDNVMEPVSVKRRPAIRETVAELEALGAVRAMMTGSGSAVYGVFAHEAAAEAAWRCLKGRYAVCELTRTSVAGVSLREE